MLSDLLRQGDIPRLLNQELKERKPPKRSVESLPKVSSSSSAKTNPWSGFDGSSNAYDPDAYDPKSGSSRGEKRKDGHNDSPSPSLTLAQGLSPMLSGDVLHPFHQQNEAWDDLWLEQDDGNDHQPSGFCQWSSQQARH